MGARGCRCLDRQFTAGSAGAKMRPALVLLLLAASCALAGADLSAQLRVWDPVAPLRWDDTLALSPLCLEQMQQLALATRNGEQWAEKSKS